MTASYDAELQKRLDLIWFRMPDAATRQKLKIPDSQLGLRQQWLLRAFQSYAKEDFVARDDKAATDIDGERLRQVELKGSARLPATSVPHGIADTATRAAIEAWASDQARLRCPVIFQARKKAKAGDADWRTVASQGFSFHDELRDKSSAVFVRDFTGRYPLSPDGHPPLVMIGKAVSFGTGIPQWGIRSTAAQSLGAVGQFSPDNLIGASWEELTARQRSNFRVVASVAFVEAGGVIDGINAYDTSVISVGPYQYTAYPASDLGKAELGAFLAYWATQSSGEFQQLSGSAGFSPMEPWGAGLRLGNSTYNARIGFLGTGGTPVNPDSVTDRNYLRTYHLFYKMQATLRSSPSMRMAFWPYARQRVSDILSASWTTADAPPGTTKIGDVFKSELSVALLLRWHVFRPTHIVSNQRAGVVPGALVAKAGLQKKRVDQWDADDEAAVAKAFLTAHSGVLAAKSASSLRTTLKSLASWSHPAWAVAGGSPGGPTLSTDRTFVVDVSGLPFPPAAQ